MLPVGREASVKRSTKETDIEVWLDIDGEGTGEVSTGIGFFDHMLQSLARHGLFDMKIKVQGDLKVDGHHTVEDVGICLGQAIKKCVGDKARIVRFGSATIPMDEVLVSAVIDLGGRPFLNFAGFDFTSPQVGEFDTDLTVEFFRALSTHSACNLHLRCLTPGNAHHMIEAAFKSFAKALDQATRIDTRTSGIPSTKGVL
jgi:imidazoleglycerol-phosphate dehydratase